jgi:XTP/dITP diphosphohydrolase
MGAGVSATMRLLFASSNPHKVDEVRAILEPLDFDLIGLDQSSHVPHEPIEDGETFQANARIKAIFYAKQTGELCLADDSGLEVDALGGAPGVHSARYSGVGDTRAERDAANNAKLLAALKDVTQEHRTARFVCAMCLASPSGKVLHDTRDFSGTHYRLPSRHKRIWLRPAAVPARCPLHQRAT